MLVTRHPTFAGTQYDMVRIPEDVYIYIEEGLKAQLSSLQDTLIEVEFGEDPDDEETQWLSDQISKVRRTIRRMQTVRHSV